MFPNFPLPTMGGRVFWKTIDENNGWKLQQNGITDHYWVLDPHDYRQAWGTNLRKMRRTFELFSGE